MRNFSTLNIKKDQLQLLTADAGEILMIKDTLITNEIIFHNDEIVALNTSVELNDTIWYGTSSGIRYRFKNDNKFYSIKNISPYSDNVLGSIIYKNRPFFTGIGSYLTVIKDSIVLNRYQSKFVSGATPIDFCIDKNNNLWSYSFSAISFLNPKTNQITLFEPSLKSSHFYSDCYSYKNVLYFVGEDYFETIELQNNDTIFKEHNILKNLGIDAVHSIDIYDDILYISSPKGLISMSLYDIDKTDFPYNELTVIDGLPEEGISEVKIDKTNNILWLTSFEGIIKFNPALKWSNEKPPKVYLKDVELFSEPIENKKLKHLDYNQNYLTFNWSTIAFNNVDQIQFSYQLDGFDDNWSKPTKELSTVYKKIPNGNYEFKIKTRYQNGKWSNPITLTKFYIDAPFYKKWWFIILIATIIIIIISNQSRPK